MSFACRLRITKGGGAKGRVRNPCAAGERAGGYDDAQAATLTSGRLSVRVEKAGDWRIEFRDGERVITSSGWRGMG